MAKPGRTPPSVRVDGWSSRSGPRSRNGYAASTTALNTAAETAKCVVRGTCNAMAAAPIAPPSTAPTDHTA